MTTTISIHLACNNSNSVHTGHVEAIALYHDDIVPVLQLEGDAIACGVARGVNGYLVLQVGYIVMRCYNYKEFVGSLIWDACRISLADAARVVNSVRAHGWTCEEGVSALYDKYAANEDITIHDLLYALGDSDELARAMEGEASE